MTLSLKVLVFLLGLVGLVACQSVSKATYPVAATSVPTLTATPNPPTSEEAIAMVRNSPEMSKAVVPFRRELGWKAEWTGDRWWVIGMFESPWGVRFVEDATIWEAKIYAYSDYSMRPDPKWVQAKAEQWGLQHMYTRLTTDEAITRVKEADSVAWSLRGTTVVDAVAELVGDSAEGATWRFAFYIIVPSTGQRVVLAVAGLGGNGVNEGAYISEYGFGNAAQATTEIPLHLLDWIRKLAKERGWELAANIP